MSLPIKNHVTINCDGVTVNGVPLLVERHSLMLTGYDDPNEVTKITLTLIPDEVTIRQSVGDPEEESHDDYPREPTPRTSLRRQRASGEPGQGIANVSPA